MATAAQRMAAWSVHLFTASGLLAGFMGLLAVERGDWRAAMLWMLLCLFIDGIDGTFARLARVREVLPYVDGKTIDYVIDFFTYAILPAYLFYHAVPVGEPWNLLGAFAMLLTTAIYYGKEGMVSEDGAHFVGFPALWNMVVYAQVFVFPGLSPAGQLAVTAAFAILHFVPILFAYPSRRSTFFWPTLIAAVVFMASVGVNVWYYPEPLPFWRAMTLLATAYFAALGVYETMRSRR